MSEKIQFSDPAPKRYGRKAFWPARLASVKKARGKWARFAGYKDVNVAANCAAYVRSKCTGFEFTSRTEDGAGVLYVRYVGKGKS